MNISTNTNSSSAFSLIATVISQNGCKTEEEVFAPLCELLDERYGESENMDEILASLGMDSTQAVKRTISSYFRVAEAAPKTMRKGKLSPMAMAIIEEVVEKNGCETEEAAFQPVCDALLERYGRNSNVDGMLERIGMSSTHNVRCNIGVYFMLHKLYPNYSARTGTNRRKSKELLS